MALFIQGDTMITTSEIAVTVTIWVLTVCGAFFGIRAAWRRKRKRREGNGTEGVT